MKHKILSLAFLLMPYIVCAQNSIAYSYDSAGNRIERAPVQTNLAYKSQKAEIKILDFIEDSTYKTDVVAISLRVENEKDDQSDQTPYCLLSDKRYCVLSTFKEPSNRYYQASLNEDRRYTKNMGYCKIE